MRFYTTHKLVDIILQNTTQEEVFAHYLGVTADDIYFCLRSRSNKINNTLRQDKKPSLGFKYDLKGKLRCKDFAQPVYNGDMFDIAAKVLTMRKDKYLNPVDKVDFITICYDVIENVVNSKKAKIQIPKNITNTTEDKLDIIKKIEIVPREWQPYDIRYWNQYGLDVNFLTDNRVIPVQYLYLQYDAPVYYHTMNDRCYAYYMGKYKKTDIYKIYFVDRKGNKQIRFITNNKLPFDFYDEFKANKYAIITKSRKDALLLKKLLKNDEVSIFAFASESIRLTKKQIGLIDSMFDNTLLWLDGDLAGGLATYYHIQLYAFPFSLIGSTLSVKKEDMGIVRDTANRVTKLTGNYVQPMDILEFLDNNIFESKAKDVSDYYKLYGKSKTIELINYNYTKLIG